MGKILVLPPASHPAAWPPAVACHQGQSGGGDVSWVLVKLF